MSRKPIAASGWTQEARHRQGAGRRTHGRSRTKEFRAWANMRKRCHDSRGPNFADYGGRGIKVCSAWLGPMGFARFLADMGEAPTPKHEVDRINNDGDYTPENCRWATRKTQNRNTRRAVLLKHAGEELPLEEWAERLGMPGARIRHRLRRGWTVAEALITPCLANRSQRGRGDGTTSELATETPPP